MKVVINSISRSKDLKDKIVAALEQIDIQVVDLYDSSLKDDVYSVTINTIRKLKEIEDAKGIIVDDNGIAPFIIANKHKDVIAAAVSDDRSAMMTTRHNNTQLIILGSEIVGPGLAINCAKNFSQSTYDAGRHQIRIDMLNSLC